MAVTPQGSRNVSLHTPLFDRFQSSRRAGLASLARDIADILGARRAVPGLAPGVLGWGLPGTGGYSPGSPDDRERLAAMIANAITRFEPRLTNVKVAPNEVEGEFSFSVSASLIQEEGAPITLRVLAPRRGGGLGADVVVLADRY